MWYNTVNPYDYHGNGLNGFFDSWFGKTGDYSSYSSREEGDRLLLSIDLPGAKSSDVKVESLTGHVKIFGKQKGKDFSQTYSLPKVYDPSSGVAKLEDGVLSLTFSKFKTTKSLVHSIEVK